MKIYRVERDIDGFGGRMKDKYFLSFELAKECVLKTSGLWFHDGKWDVEGMRECRCHEENESLSLLGIQYPQEEKDEYCIDWCRVSITPIELGFDIVDNAIFILKYVKGYNNWLFSSLDGTSSNEAPAIVEYCRSNKSARKISARRKDLKHIARCWVNPEAEDRISPIGHGENYLSIEKVVLQ